MYSLEIFWKKRKFSPIYKAVWPVLSANLAYPPDTENEPEQRLVFFGALSYATVYQSCLAAGMSSSAGHYMARTFLRQFKFEGWINEAVIAIFAPEDDAAQAYADDFLARVGSLVKTIRGGAVAEGTAIEPPMTEVAGIYRKVTFSTR